jgi:ketopantoate hydroxymethyltransferase
VARLVDHEVDLLLVGDSLAMTVYGFESTLPIGLDTMIAHGAGVVRSTEKALVVVDLPFGQLSGLARRRLSRRRTGPRRDWLHRGKA